MSHLPQNKQRTKSQSYSDNDKQGIETLYPRFTKWMEQVERKKDTKNGK